MKVGFSKVTEMYSKGHLEAVPFNMHFREEIEHEKIII